MKKYFVVSVIACSILFICTSILDNVNFILQADRQSIEKDCGYLYMTIQHESDPTKMPLNINTLGKFISLYKNLSSSALYSYYEIYTQPLCSLPDKSIMIPSVQISENVPEDFGMEVNEGRLLNSYDFTISSGNIAVLLGSDYIGTYEIGDSFDAEYLFYDYTFEVIGFLKEGLQIKRSDGTILLNDAVVMPSFSVHTMPKSDEEMLSYIIHYTKLSCLSDYGVITSYCSSQSRTLSWRMPL